EAAIPLDQGLRSRFARRVGLYLPGLHLLAEEGPHVQHGRGDPALDPRPQAGHDVELSLDVTGAGAPDQSAQLDPAGFDPELARQGAGPELRQLGFEDARRGLRIGRPEAEPELPGERPTAFRPGAPQLARDTQARSGAFREDRDRPGRLR